MRDVKIFRPDKKGKLKLFEIIPAEELSFRFENLAFSFKRKSVMQAPINNYVPDNNPTLKRR